MPKQQMRTSLPRYFTTTKNVGETPLEALSRERTRRGIDESIPLAYAGRLDPMASGKLLILVGDECKVQEQYHSFDKEYTVEVLLGVSSDTGDVLGLISSQCIVPTKSDRDIRRVLHELRGEIHLPYPHFSSRTVQGKPLHTWALEGNIDTIQIPIKSSRIHAITLLGIRPITKSEILQTVRKKIETIPPVTEKRKVLGADFRRSDIRASWNQFEAGSDSTYLLLNFTCTSSSGTYMRSLAEYIGKKLGSCGLAYSIHRTKIGTYVPILGNIGLWVRQF